MYNIIQIYLYTKYNINIIAVSLSIAKDNKSIYYSPPVIVRESRWYSCYTRTYRYINILNLYCIGFVLRIGHLLVRFKYNCQWNPLKVEYVMWCAIFYIISISVIHGKHETFWSGNYFSYVDMGILSTV